MLAAYSKIELTQALTASNLADDPYFDRVLRGYFPQELVERFGDDLSGHPLRREIIATVVANDMINMGGITFAFRAWRRPPSRRPTSRGPSWRCARSLNSTSWWRS